MKAFVCVLSVAVTVGAILAHAEPLDKCKLQPEPRDIVPLKNMDYYFTEDRRFVAKVASSLTVQFNQSKEITYLDLPVREIKNDPKADNVVLFQTDCAEMRFIVDKDVRNASVSRINIQYKFASDGEVVEGACNVILPGIRWSPGSHYTCPRTIFYWCKPEHEPLGYRVDLMLQAFEFEIFDEPQPNIGFTTRQAVC